VIAIHDALLTATHVQSRVVSMAMVPVEPSADADDGEFVTDTWHFGALGAVVVIDDDPQAVHASAVARGATVGHSTALRRNPIRMARNLQT
jgi:hypothetical protein